MNRHVAPKQIACVPQIPNLTGFTLKCLATTFEVMEVIEQLKLPKKSNLSVLSTSRVSPSVPVAGFGLYSAYRFRCSRHGTANWVRNKYDTANANCSRAWYPCTLPPR